MKTNASVFWWNLPQMIIPHTSLEGEYRKWSTSENDQHGKIRKWSTFESLVINEKGKWSTSENDQHG